MNAENEFPLKDERTPDTPVKKKYHKPSIQVYGTLAQMTETTFNPGRRADNPGGPSPLFRRT